MSGVEYPVTVGLLATLLGGTAQSFVWFTVGAGLLLGVALQIAAALVAAYLVVTTISAHHPVRHHGDERRGPHTPHAAHLATT